MYDSVKICSRWAILSILSVCSYVFWPLIDHSVPQGQGPARFPRPGSYNCPNFGLTKPVRDGVHDIETHYISVYHFPLCYLIIYFSVGIYR
jgi:hypothetical protein